MKIIRRSLPQGDAGSVAQRCAKKLGLLVVGIVAALALLGPSRAAADQSTPITQLGFLKIMVQVSGDTPSFNANSTAADYVLWARGKGVNVALQPNAPLSRALLSQALVQLLQINPNKLGGDPTRILAREGITIDGTSTDPVTLPDVLSLLGGLQGRILHNPHIPEPGWWSSRSESSEEARWARGGATDLDEEYFSRRHDHHHGAVRFVGDRCLRRRDTRAGGAGAWHGDPSRSLVGSQALFRKGGILETIANALAGARFRSICRHSLLYRSARI